MTAVIVVALVALEMFVMLAEQAITHAHEGTLAEAARAGRAGSERALWFRRFPDRLSATTLLVSRLCMLTAASVTAVGFDHPEWTLIVLLPALFLSAELLPRTLLGGHADTLAPRLATPLMLLQHLLRPFVVATEAWSRVWRRPGNDVESPPATREEIQALVDQESDGGTLPAGEREMISRIFSFSHLTAADSMIPLSQVCAISSDATVEQAAALIAREGYSRLPVYRDRMEEVVGVLHHIDLLRAEDAKQSVALLARAPHFAPETQEIDDLLVILQRRASTAAIVVDEFGKTVGLLTLEDILEEIVGEIDDEFDQGSRWWRPAVGGGWIVNARATRAQFEELFGVALDAEADVETVGGYLLGRFKRIPRAGDELELDVHPRGVKLIVTRATDRAIEELRVTGPLSPRDASS
jgi:CBS domain containing-hemolysin-like protein